LKLFKFQASFRDAAHVQVIHCRVKHRVPVTPYPDVGVRKRRWSLRIGEFR
jgi:hypothetical protein